MTAAQATPATTADTTLSQAAAREAAVDRALDHGLRHRLAALGLAASVTLTLLLAVSGMAAQEDGALAWARAAQAAAHASAPRA